MEITLPKVNEGKRAFIIAGIKNLMEQNYEVSSELIDLEAEVDSTLTMKENWERVKPKVLILCRKREKIK